jgi:hypothetical protein
VKTPPTITDQTGIPSQDAVETSLAASAERRSLNDWIRIIHQAWSSGTDCTMELARLMSRARQCLHYGSWSRLCRSGTLPFSKRKGDMLVVIGQGLGELDAHNRAQLPLSLHTLYFLARLDRKAVEQLIVKGRIGPKMSLREARSLLRETPAESEPKNSCSRIKARLERLAGLIRAESGSWPEEERKSVHRQILALANEIRDEKTTLGSVASKGQMLVVIGKALGSSDAHNCAQLDAASNRDTLQSMEDKASIPCYQRTASGQPAGRNSRASRPRSDLVSIGPLQVNQQEHVGHHLSTL